MAQLNYNLYFPDAHHRKIIIYYLLSLGSLLDFDEYLVYYFVVTALVATIYIQKSPVSEAFAQNRFRHN